MKMLLLRRNPPRRLLSLSRNTRPRVLPQPSRPHLRSPQAQRVALLLPRLLQEMGLEQLSPRYPSLESLDQLAPLLNFKNLRRASSLPGRGSCALTALQRLLILCWFLTKGNRLLLLRRLTPTTRACQCHLLTLRPLWTLRPTLGMTSALSCTYMTSAFPFHEICC